MATTIKMGAEPFMKYLAELQTKYFERVNQELVAYFATEPVETLTRRLSSHANHTYESLEKYQAAWSALRSAIADLPPHHFSGGVEIDMSLYLQASDKKWHLLHAENFNFRITLIRARKRADKLLRVEINDDRFGLVRGWKPFAFSESFSVPPRFYDFLRHNVCEDESWSGYSNFKDCVYRQLARNGEALCVFDRPAKLKALAALVAA